MTNAKNKGGDAERDISLIDADANASQGNEGETPSDAAIDEGRAETVRALGGEPGALANPKDDDVGRPSCMLWPTSSELVRQLVELGKDVDVKRKGGDWRGTRGYGWRPGRGRQNPMRSGRNSVAPRAYKRTFIGGAKKPRRPAKTNR